MDRSRKGGAAGATGRPVPSAPRIDARTRLAAVIGWPVEHSRSPTLHNAAYAATGMNAVYVALPVAPDRLAEALAGIRALGFLGVNVTVPHKEAAIASCHRVDPLAASVGAVNTIVVRPDGRLAGYNTDVGGFQDSLEEEVPDVLTSRGRAVVLGAGGAARAVTLALRERRLEVVVVARDVERARGLLRLGAGEALPWTKAALAAALPGANLLVDSTSAGLSRATEKEIPAPIPLDLLPDGAVVCSLVYHRKPALLAAARARGLRVVDGSGMLIHQAARAFTLMTGTPAPVEAMRVAFHTAA